MCGNRPLAAKVPFSLRCSRIFLITAGSSMHAITRSAPPQARQVSSGTSLYPTASRQPAAVPIGYPAELATSMLKTRRRRWAQVIEARRLPTGRSFAGSITRGMLPLPRFAGVTWARWRLLGANTP